MIYDKIDNLETYTGISEDIRLGLRWLRDVNPDIENGVYKLSPRVKAIVSEYTTKEVNENGYEAHRVFIDIQFLLKGSEKICSLPLEYLRETKMYKADIDAAFYKEASVKPQEMVLGSGYFAVFFPQDGHMPGLFITEECVVKKIVVKVLI
jgi:YhcH/YjgK/YiaL family protein